MIKYKRRVDAEEGKSKKFAVVRFNFAKDQEKLRLGFPQTL